MRRRLLNDGWEVRPRASRFAEMQGQAAPWQPVTLPHDAMVGLPRAAEHGPANAYFPGGAWQYRRTLDLPEDAPQTVVLELEGVYRDAAVLVDGQVAARWPGGYSRSHVPLDHLLRPGPNQVEVHASAGADSRWYTGAGLYRDVWLLESGPVHLAAAGLAVRTPEADAEGAVVEVTADVVNRSTGTSAPVLRVELLDAGGTVVAVDEAPVTVFPGRTATVQRRLFVDQPRRWSPANPVLHTCRAQLRDGDDVVDEDSTSFGIRTLALDARRGLRVNGEPVLLRGACVHHDNGPLGAATFARAEERRVERLKAAGFNAVRSAHNPMSRAMLDACDRLGVLVMEEAFDTWLEAKSPDDYARRFQEWAERDLEAMVRNAHNHPSVVFYSIGNEIPDGSTPTGLEVARRLAAKVRSLDDSRYVVQAVTGILVGGDELWADFREQLSKAPEEAGVNTMASTLGDLMLRAMTSRVVDEKTAEAFAVLDAAGYNYMHSRYRTDAEAYPSRVVVGTESHPAAIADVWALVRELPGVIGDFTWTGWDYLGEAGVGRALHADPAPDGSGREFHGPFPWRTAWCGDIDMTGQRRPQSYYRETVFGLRTDPYLAVLPPAYGRRPNAHHSPWSWDDLVPSWSWPGAEGQTLAVTVYAGGDEVELLLDGRSLGRQPVDGFRTCFEVAYAPGRLEAVGYAGGVEVGRSALRSADPGDLRLALSGDTEQLGGSGDLAFVDITLADSAGTVHVTADRPVEVAVEGSGVLQALSSAAPAVDEPFTGTSCTTFRGRALAVVRPAGDGEVTVRVAAEGCTAQTLRLRAGAVAP